MPTVEVPRISSASVSLALLPWRRSMTVKNAVPSGRARNASAKTVNDHSVAVSGSAKEKYRAGNTMTEAMAKTKKSKNSDDRPMTTPTAMSEGETWMSFASSGSVEGVCAALMSS